VPTTFQGLCASILEEYGCYESATIQAWVDEHNIDVHAQVNWDIIAWMHDTVGLKPWFAKGGSKTVSTTLSGGVATADEE